MKGISNDTNIGTRSRQKLQIRLLTGAIVLSLGLFFTFKLLTFQHALNEVQEQFVDESEIEPLRPPTYSDSPEKLRAIFDDKVFFDKALSNFQGAIKIDTQSYDDFPNPKDDIKPWLKFYKLHDYLKKTFPLVHETLKLEKPNKINLLYTWEGSNPGLKPLLLTAHQDTVPVDENTVDQWKYDPFSAHFDNTSVWGRGTVDCKQLLVGLLESVEKLIKDGFKPQRTVILAFGHDEESGGIGAAAINETLTEKYGHDSIYAIVDEGSTITETAGNWYAIPATGEKGRFTLKISLSTPGGHSSIPPDHTSIGIVAQLINLLEANQFKPVLTVKNPFLQFLKTLAKTSKSLPDSIKRDILRAEFDPKANERIVKFITTDNYLKYLIQTSQAIDVIGGGVKYNALPEYVSFIYNARIGVESTVKDTTEHVLKYIKEIAEKFDLGIYLGEETIIEPTKKGFFKIYFDEALEPLPVSPSSGSVWDVLEGTVKHVYEDEVLEKGTKIHVAPAIMTGNTDTKSYYRLTKNIFRFYGARLDLLGGNFGLHSINEHIPFKSYLEGVAFLYEFIQNVDNAKDE